LGLLLHAATASPTIASNGPHTSNAGSTHKHTHTEKSEYVERDRPHRSSTQPPSSALHRADWPEQNTTSHLPSGAGKVLDPSMVSFFIMGWALVVALLFSAVFFFPVGEGDVDHVHLCGR
ncbi:hypothetical protein Taro_052860, partial [Colocasia esculenta]|nr:hypothetical protein [Colocasia esculenta]